ncbi:MAG: CDP-diacylglycerol--glycerol-3-phosphate 3-phosphatidyltransferase [candidate division KSB1 bacterium]|nr:CDP-diacylglycerol--glycerol-3-phosphate 3-phosphatidyltransferase [candidate division KSB1 bacterium]
MVFIIASLTDWYDGYVARKMGHITKWGKFLDPLADKILILAIFSSLAWLGVIKVWMVAIIVVRDVVVTLLRTYAEWKRRPIVTSNTAKWKTAGQMVAIHLLLLYLLARSHALATGVTAGWLVWVEQSQAIEHMMLFVTLLTLLTGIQYLIENWRHLRDMIVAFYRVFDPGNLAK